MTTKDYIYLGMIVLTALAFYCNGFYAGVYRCKKMYDSLLDDADQEGDATTPTDSATQKEFSPADNSLSELPPLRHPDVHLSNRELRGDFGKN